MAIVDGFFLRRPAVRHKEILDLLATGVQVHGAASMGALRAAELTAFGMVGHGRIFADYASGEITADDEVALLHGTEEEDYEVYTEALVNVRYALGDAVAAGLLPSDVASTFLSASSRLPFVERTRDAVIDAGRRAGLGTECVRDVARVLRDATDFKRVDALNLLASVLATHAPAQETKPAWQLCASSYLQEWRAQARGRHVRELGWITETEVHRLAQVVAADYATFREAVALRVLATTHAASMDDLFASSCRERELGGTLFADPRLEPMEQQPTAQTNAISALRRFGLLDPGAQGDPGLDRWCTTAEGSLAPIVRSCKAAARALFPHSALLWGDPFLAALQATEAYSRVQAQLVECRRYHQELLRKRPAFHPAQLKGDNILAYFAEKWRRNDMEDAVLERGFATIDDFLDSARNFYLYDKARRDAPPLRLM
ncbi:TfuA-like protein [Streptomyces sp. NPDC060027]|uniref:TfuA-like protein n=1 Tax=Streptomyces sp. NPDC060027 TaxID=3347040 RepID=UPI0036865A68